MTGDDDVTPPAPRFVDLFAGLGGFRLALEAQGMTCVFGSDYDKHAAEIYRANFGDDIYSDVSTLDAESLPDFDVLCGGFPCQPFSPAGSRKGFEDARGTVFFDVCRIVEAKQPAVVFLENVKSLLTHDSGNTFKVIVSSLEKLGYTVSYQVLNALDFGVPQSRERVIIVACKDDGADTADNENSAAMKAFDFSTLTKQPRKKIADILEQDVDHDWLGVSEYVLIDDSLVQTKERTGLRFAGYLHGSLRKGMNPESVHLSRVHRQYKRIYSDQGAHSTLSSTESSGRYYIHTQKPDGEFGVRRLTMTECFRLFGFPDDYVKIGSVTGQYRRIGNSVCVPMLTEIGQQLIAQGKVQNP